MAVRKFMDHDARSLIFIVEGQTRLLTHSIYPFQASECYISRQCFFFSLLRFISSSVLLDRSYPSCVNVEVMQTVTS